MNNSITVYENILRENLSKKRYKHCLNVAEKAVCLAKKYGEDESKSHFAGLLHDVTKEMPEDEQLQLIKKAGMSLSEMETQNKKLWHAVSGTAFLMVELNVKDEDILNAVRYHTTGRAGMSRLEKIVFLADMISDDRTFDKANIARRLSEKNLDKAVCYSTILSIEWLVKKKVPIALDTVNAYNDTVKSYNNA